MPENVPVEYWSFIPPKKSPEDIPIKALTLLDAIQSYQAPKPDTADQDCPDDHCFNREHAKIVITAGRGSRMVSNQATGMARWASENGQKTAIP